jgi:resuscitation-promoting factor RpfE
MKKFVLVALAAMFLLVVTPIASAKQPTSRHRGVYFYLRRHVIKKYNVDAAGRNIAVHGMRSGRSASDADIVQSNTVMERELAPSPPAPVALVAAQPVTPTTEPAATYSASGGYTIPASIVQCESGGNYSAVNPSSGAGGAYQILPSTWTAYGGTGSPQNASPAEQGQIAAKIWASQGPSAWVC